MPVPRIGNNRFSRAERLVRAEYNRVFDEGKSFPSRYFVLWVLPLDDVMSPPKMGAVVSKKTFPHAVQRNRARRLMREAYRLSKSCVADGHWLLLIGRRRIAEDSTGRDDVLRDFKIACMKAHLWREKK